MENEKPKGFHAGSTRREILDAARDRYTKAAHKVQTAIAFMIGKPEYKAADPKHLRVGIDIAMADHGSLVRLLIEKGVITESEYFEAVAVGAEREAKSQEEQLQAMYGSKVKVGG